MFNLQRFFTGSFIFDTVLYGVCKTTGEAFNLYMTITAFWFTLLFLDVHISCRKKVLKWATTFCLVLTVSMELVYNGKLTLGLDNQVEHFRNYTREEERLVSQVKERDGGFYRMHETSTRSGDSSS